MPDFAGLGFELRLFVRVDAVEKEIEGHLRLQQFAFAQRADVSPGGRRNHNGVAPPLTGFSSAASNHWIRLFHESGIATIFEPSRSGIGDDLST